MCRDASRNVVRGLGGSGSGRCIPGEGDGFSELDVAGSGKCIPDEGDGFSELDVADSIRCIPDDVVGSSTMIIFFFLGALSGAPLGRPRFFGSGLDAFS